MEAAPTPGPARAERFLRACRGRPVDVTPVWMMRQAGRSLPAYRALRDRFGFLEVIRRPDLMASVTLMPLDELDVDAAIMFADIMLPLASLGIEFDIVENVGPVVADPIRSGGQVSSLARRPIAEAVPAVLEAIRLVRKELDGGVPLIGFSGAPFTLACYLVEGRASREFSATRAFMFEHPAAWHSLMERLTEMVVEYLDEQIAAGVQAVQLFDSWIGVLGRDEVERSVLPHTERIFARLASSGVPSIHFGTGTASMLDLMARPDCDVVGVDWRIPLDDAWDRLDGKAVQGNLDPAVLLGPPDLVVQRARDVLRRAAGRPGHVFNLGHGVLPGSSLDNLKLLVDTVHAYRAER